MTSPSPLERLAGPGNLLGKEPPDAKEFAGLVRSGLARLKDAENDANSLDSRFDLTYSAAHALCLAALRHHGSPPTRRAELAPCVVACRRPVPTSPDNPMLLDLLAEDSWLNVYAGELEVRPPLGSRRGTCRPPVHSCRL